MQLSGHEQSDIEHYARSPAVRGAIEAEPMVGHSLDEVRGMAAVPVNGCAQSAFAQLELVHPGGNEILCLGEEEKLAEVFGK
jgi:hypothetical protein